MKWEATFAITFAIAEGDYAGAEEVAWQVFEFLKGWEKFLTQAKSEAMLLKLLST